MLAFGAAGVVATAFAAENQAPQVTNPVLEHMERRLLSIRSALAEAQPGFVFLAGNSHAELLGDPLSRFLPVINGGIGGTSARGYAARLDAMPFAARARAAMLFIGTNDIIRTGRPLSTATLAGFEAAATRIVGWLRDHADVVLVAAVPPIGPEAVATRDPTAVIAYSAALEALCKRDGCRFFDPFVRMRGSEVGVTTQTAPPDGVHLRDYDAVVSDLVRILGSSATSNQ